MNCSQSSGVTGNSPSTTSGVRPRSGIVRTLASALSQLAILTRPATTQLQHPETVCSGYCVGPEPFRLFAVEADHRIGIRVARPSLARFKGFNASRA